MMRSAAAAYLVAVVLAGGALPAPAASREGVHNGGFELGRDQLGDRPAHWLIGFPDEPSPSGEWALVADPAAGGHLLELRTVGGEGFFVSQVVDLPAATMTGVEVRVATTVDMAGGETWAAAQVVALNPEAPIDPELGVAHVGDLTLVAAEAGRHELAGTFTLTGPAELIAVVLVVAGTDAVAAFDDVSVAADVVRPGCGPPVATTWLPASGPPAYPVGFTNENPRNLSDNALADLAARLAEAADVINLFAHVRWNSLAGLPLLDGHDRIARAAVDARRYDLQRMLTFDFTHGSLDGLGDINPMPDGTPVGRLDDAGVADAYLDELVALVEATAASIVSVGIETDFFLEAHPDQWHAYRSMLCAARTRLRAVDPAIHVTTYFTLGTLVQPDLSPNIAGQVAYTALAPCFDSVGYSYYPADGSGHLADVPAGMFSAAAAVAPGMPLIIPEFGFRSDGIYTEEEQAGFLRRAMDELAGFEVVAMIVYSLYDQTYFGVEPLFQESFRSIGVRHLDGTPKEAWRLLRYLRWLRRTPLPGGIAPAAECAAGPRSSSPARQLAP